MKEHYYVTLDVGSSSVKAVVGEKFHDGVNIIGTGQTYTDGLSKGTITDFETVKNAIKDTVKKAKISSGVDTDEIFLKIPLVDTQIQFENEALRLGNQTEIHGEHIEELLEQVRNNVHLSDREVVSVIPLHFKVDDLHEVTNPNEMVANHALSVHAAVVTIHRTMLMNLIKCVEDAGLEVIDVYSDALNYQHLLGESEIELGTVVIDVGSDLTQYAYYERGGLKHAGSIQMGGHHVTNDLCEAFNTNYEEAERAKKQFGYAFYDLANSDDLIQFSQRDGSEDLEITPADMADIIELRMEEIFVKVFEELAKNKINKVTGGFVITGGSANLVGVKELMQDLVSEKVRVHVPYQMGARKPEFSSVISTVSSGILFDELLEYVTIDNYDNPNESVVEVEDNQSSDNFFSSIFNRRKTNEHLDVERTGEENDVSDDIEVTREYASTSNNYDLKDYNDDSNREEGIVVETDLDESSENSDYRVDTSHTPVEEDYLDYQDENDENVLVKRNKTAHSNESKNYGEYMKKFFKNLFE